MRRLHDDDDDDEDNNAARRKMSVWDLTASGVIRWRGMIVVVES